MKVKITKLSSNYNATISKGDSCTGVLSQIVIELDGSIGPATNIRSLSTIKVGNVLLVKVEGMTHGDFELSWLRTSPLIKVKHSCSKKKKWCEVTTVNSVYLVEQILRSTEKKMSKIKKKFAEIKDKTPKFSKKSKDALTKEVVKRVKEKI